MAIYPVLGQNTPRARDSLESPFVTGPGQSVLLAREGTQSQVREARATALSSTDGFDPVEGLTQKQDITLPCHLASYCWLHH